MAKATCSITCDKFLETAPSVEITINGQPFSVDPRQFSTGSFGWYLTGKISVLVDGKPVFVQVGCNLTVVGSKPTK